MGSPARTKWTWFRKRRPQKQSGPESAAMSRRLSTLDIFIANRMIPEHKPHTACVTPSMNGFIHEGDEWVIYPWEKDDSETIQDYLK